MRPPTVLFTSRPDLGFVCVFSALSKELALDNARDHGTSRVNTPCPSASTRSSCATAWRIFGLRYASNLTSFGFLSLGRSMAHRVLTRTNRTVHELCSGSSGLLTATPQWRSVGTETTRVIPLHASTVMCSTLILYDPPGVRAPLQIPSVPCVPKLRSGVFIIKFNQGCESSYHIKFFALL